MTFPKRTHTCGDLRITHVGSTVTLQGWVQRRRDLGDLIFIDLRDRYGLTQIVFSPDHMPALHALAHELRPEFVVSVTGTVRPRPDGQANTAMITGDIEVLADELLVLNRSELTPFEVKDDVDAHEDLRLTYRYLDLRRPSLQRNLLLRHKVYQITHRYFDALDFIEVETPVLMKSTPEGARDYLVPSRVHPGSFYALPQSPQTYKQLLMVAGFDRYVQITKCFRDEDLRADRQPEFTQIDLEMSFVRRDDIFETIEGLISRFLTELIGVEHVVPFPRMTYDEALSTYGSDKPDLRFGMAFTHINDIVVNSGFKVFADVAQRGGVVAAITVPGQASISRSKIDALTERARALGMGGLAYFKAVDGDLQSPVAKFLSPEIMQRLRTDCGAADGDLILAVADVNRRAALLALGTLRLELAREFDLVDTTAHRLLWVTDFPLVQWDEEAGRWVAEHHPFTSPHPQDIPLLESDPAAVRADCYDLVWNGNEIASGSIRIHDAELQNKVFKLIGLSDEEIAHKFGFLLGAFKYGAPPHGGAALGLDRIITILAGLGSIRDVIAFPKTNSALSLMDGSPSTVAEAQLRELRIGLQTS